MEMISKAVVDGSLESLKANPSDTEQSSSVPSGRNRRERRALAKLQRKDERLKGKIKQLESQLRETQ